MKKTLYLTFTALLFTVQSHAKDKSKIYLVEPMTCEGKQTSANGYGDIKMTFTSFQSTRKDGKLANSLEIKTTYSSNYYTSPLYISKDGVISKGLGFQEHLKLKRISTKESKGKQTDTFAGTFTYDDSVVGDQRYSLNCTANVVEKVSRIDDYVSKQKNKGATLKQLSTVTNGFNQDWLDGADACSVSVSLGKDGAIITLTDESSEKLDFNVSATDVIKYKSKDEDDGSFDRVFRVLRSEPADGEKEEVARLQLFHMDDAYVFAELTVGKKSKECRLEF